MRITTWNVNSVRARLPLIERFVKETGTDILCLQETKCRDEMFPLDPFREAGFEHIALHGQKAHNGVAILSRVPFSAPDTLDWCGRGDARHLSVQVKGVRIHNFYVPAGGDIPDPGVNDKFAHKLSFLEEMTGWAPKQGGPLIMVGDLNVAPLETDVWSHKALVRVVSHTPPETERMGRLLDSHDWLDAMRHFVPESEKLYSWWSYRSPDWRRADKGRRLDHIWATEDLKPRLQGLTVSKETRGWERPSDHVPVSLDIDL